MLVILRKVFKLAVNQFLSSMLVLNYICFYVAISLNFPPMVQSFISALITLLNFDLLGSFDWANVPLIPRETLVNELTPALGFI